MSVHNTALRTRTREIMTRQLLGAIDELRTGRTVTDGRLQVAQSVADISELVSVDDSTAPFTTQPADLFDRKFSDDSVGIDDDSLITAFVAKLEQRLPSIAEVIEQKLKPTLHPDIEIERVAQFVLAALQRAR